MNNKKESSFVNIFIYLLIIIFIILIALPPVLRIVFKETETPVNNESNSDKRVEEKITALNCNREVMVGTMLYKITISSNYTNDELTKVTFMYNLPETVDSAVTEDQVMTEINTIRSSGLVKDESTDAQIRLILTKELKEANPDNTSLDNFFQPMDLQQSSLESSGYTCSILTA